MASLTVPNLITNYQKKSTLTKLRKMYGALQQVVQRSELDNGSVLDWNATTDTTQMNINFNKYWAPYLRIAKICKDAKDCGYSSDNSWVFLDKSDITGIVLPDRRTTVYLADGSVLAFLGKTTNANHDDIATRVIFYDTNGPLHPNTIGKDVFIFDIVEKGFEFNGANQSDSTINANCSSTGNGFYCGEKIFRDDWQMKDKGPDAYPW